MAKEIANVRDTAKDHIPELLWHHKLTNPTSSIREALGSLESTKGSRVLYILVFPKLFPITKLHGDDLFNAWRQCILCHIILWKAGVYHRDVGPGSMMWYRDTLGRLMGVLNDYDLSSLGNVPCPQGNERTGTVPFMALDLLIPEAQPGEVKHLYRHDLESFMWGFVWICFRYRNGSLLPPASRPLDAWATSGAETCFQMKLIFPSTLARFRSDIEKEVWHFIVECVRLLQRGVTERAELVFDQLLETGKPEAVDEESESAIDSCLHRFSSTERWVVLERRVLSQ